MSADHRAGARNLLLTGLHKMPLATHSGQQQYKAAEDVSNYSPQAAVSSLRSKGSFYSISILLEPEQKEQLLFTNHKPKS